MKSRLMLVGLLLLAAYVSLLASQSIRPVSAHTVQTTLRAQHSGKCLTAYGFSNGGLAFQWACGVGNNVSIEDAGGGYHYIRFLHSNKCLTVSGNASWDGAALDQWDCLGQPNQKWSGQFTGGGFEVHASQLNPGKCITVAGEAWWDGAAVNQWQCVGRSNQAWTPAPCHLSYQGGTDTQTGGCIRDGVGDYDCAPPNGDGPNYVRGPVRVVGPDVFRLDGDGNGVGCQ